MRISKKWLQEYVYLPDSLTAEELAFDLKMKTVEVEGIEKLGSQLVRIVVGNIIDIQPHPNADRLRICMVDVGQAHPLQVVCGGSNLVVGMKVALGQLGAHVLWHGEGQPVELTETTIRGVASYGMICGADEIGLEAMFPKKEEKEIVDLSSYDVKAGTPLAVALGLDDVIFEIDNKSLSNRPDLWGHYGIAREIGAMYRKELAVYAPSKIVAGSQGINVAVAEPTLCTRFMAVTLDQLSVGASPTWMQQRLLSVGIRPINLVVDITNYVMVDLGQPMHAYDAAQVSKNNKGEVQLFVRRASAEEVVTALDKKEYQLTPDMLVIADAVQPLAIAGIMGGLTCAVTEKTTTIILEAATFHAASVRKTSTSLGLRTDASARFEKSLDPMLPDIALRRAVELILQCCPNAQVISKVVDVFKASPQVDPIELSVAMFEERIGVPLTKKEIIPILERLGFEIKEKKDLLRVTVPSWRATKDIAIQEDLIEEVARMYGYGNIPATLPYFPITPPEKNQLRTLERRTKQLLSKQSGFTEVTTYSFVSPEFLLTIGEDLAHYIELDHPIAKDRPFLRRNLRQGLIETVQKNQRTLDTQLFFEIGRTYLIEESGQRAEPKGDELLPKQDTWLGLVCAQKGLETPFFLASDAVQQLLSECGISFMMKKDSVASTFFHPGRTAQIVVAGVVIGIIGEIHPQVQKKLGLDQRTAIAEINLCQLLAHLKPQDSYKALALFPAVQRDVALLVDADIEHATLWHAMKQSDPLVESVELFDVYTGDRLPAHKKSLAYHIVYRSPERTLTTQEVETVHEVVLNMLKKTFGAELR